MNRRKSSSGQSEGQSPIPSTRNSNLSEEPAGSTTSILIVDDDKTNVKVLQRVFAKAEGFKIVTGDDGQDLVRLMVRSVSSASVYIISRPHHT